MDNKMNRKEFLQKLGLLGIVGVGGTAVLNSCGGESKEAAKPPAPAAAKTGDDPCGDLTGLTDIDKATRKNLQYAAKSTDPKKECDICNFWVKPEAGNTCGACQLVKGPINPKGSCISFAPKQTPA